MKSTHKKGAIPKEIVVGVTSYGSVVVSDEMTRNQGGPVEGEILSNRADTLVARWDLVAAKPGGTTVMNRPVYRFVVYKKDLTATLEATGQTMHNGLHSRTHLGRGSCKAIKDPRVLAKLQQDARAAKARKQARSSDDGCLKQGAGVGSTSAQDGPSSNRWCP
ncbi:hypothetical protein ACS3QZ_02800 [Shimia sp. W99]